MTTARIRLPLSLAAALVVLGCPAGTAESHPRGPVDAAFQQESYRPGTRAALRVEASVGELTLQIFRSGPERRSTRGDDTMLGGAHDVRAARPRRPPPHSDFDRGR